MDEHPKNPFRRAARDPAGSMPRPGPKAATRGRARNPASEEGAERRPGLRRLPGEFQDLADGRVDRLRRPRRPPEPLEDERLGALVPGVRNSEARAVYDARVAGMRAAHAAGRDDELEQGLLEAQRLTLWRARNVTDLRAFAESVVGLPADHPVFVRLEQHADEPCLPAHAIALQIRVEAALVQRAPIGRARLQPGSEGLRLELSVPVDEVARAIEALDDIGRAAAGLRRFLRADATLGGERQQAEGAERERAPHWRSRDHEADGGGDQEARARRGPERRRRDQDRSSGPRHGPSRPRPDRDRDRSAADPRKQRWRGSDDSSRSSHSRTDQDRDRATADPRRRREHGPDDAYSARGRPPRPRHDQARERQAPDPRRRRR